MTSALIAKQFELTYETAKKNLAGITHDESLRCPSPAGNSVNWVIGHIVATRNVLMRTLGAAPIWSAAEAALYERGTKPPVDGRGTRRLEDIMAALDRSQEEVLGRIRALSPDALGQASPMGTVADVLTVLGFHEAYHVGQLGLQRRLLAKDGAIA